MRTQTRVSRWAMPPDSVRYEGIWWQGWWRWREEGELKSWWGWGRMLLVDGVAGWEGWELKERILDGRDWGRREQWWFHED